MEVDELSPVAQDYLKVIWSATEWGEPPITTKGLATRFATTAANVSATLRRLQGQGLVEYRPYRPATLTALGRAMAVAMVRRHRLLEAFLAQTLGYGWGEVHAEAERLEHAVTDDLLNRIDQLLGHPRFDPHGDPIPNSSGEWIAGPPTEALATVAPGEYRIARVSDADPVMLAELARRGLVPGALVVVDSATAATGEAAIALGSASASAVRVWCSTGG